jgi:hypothetical protein
MDNIVATIAKYTGHDLRDEELLAALQADLLRRQLTQALGSAALAVSATEAELRRVTASITDSLTAVSQNLAAGPGHTVRSINPIGELQANAPRFDALIARRDAEVGHLKTLTRLWQTATNPNP